MDKDKKLNQKFRQFFEDKLKEYKMKVSSFHFSRFLSYYKDRDFERIDKELKEHYEKCLKAKRVCFNKGEDIRGMNREEINALEELDDTYKYYFGELYIAIEYLNNGYIIGQCAVDNIDETKYVVICDDEILRVVKEEDLLYI